MSDFQYSVEIQTGDGRGHDTDANVTISLYGSIGKIEDVPLKKSSTHRNPFERGNIDRFMVESSYLGNIQKITLKCDKSGRGASWFVKWVNIKAVSKVPDTAHGSQFDFQVHQWFSNRRGWQHTIMQSIGVVSMEPVEGYTELHNTKKFQDRSHDRVILRRGLSVKFRMTLKRAYENSDSDFEIVLTTGKRARESNKTMAVAHNSTLKEYKEKVAQGVWAFEILESTGEEILVELFIPSTAMVGAYKMVIECNDGVIFEYDGDIVILFNPWCENDEVYMNTQKDIKEYVLSQHGIVYQGAWRRPYGKKWYFGQFEKIVLDVVLYLLEKIPKKKRLSAVEITRRFTSLCNSLDNDGILVGNWSGEYDDGRSPSFWSTTPAILQTYVDDGYEPVKYGQCWVFSALTTTLMRAMGIPCRPVTNFQSAHDTDENVSNDVYVNSDGVRDTDKTTDSVWNFHVWNDVWFRRDDLSRDGVYDGWQAIDATPQEVSSGFYQTGPSPLKAIKNGQVDQNYDSKFVFAEVNAETIYWLVEGDKDPVPVERDTMKVGRAISTKAVGSYWRNDITDEYKFADGSHFESAAVRKALRIAENPVITVENILHVDIEPVKDDYCCGQNLELKMKIHNKSSEDQSVLMNAKPQLIRYTGEVIADLKAQDDRRKVKVQKESVLTIPYTIPASLYVPRMKGDESVQVHLTASIPGRGYLATTFENIELSKPEIQIKVDESKTITSGEETECEISFQNPLDVPLKNCGAYLGGSTLARTIYDWRIPDVPAQGKFVKTYKFTPMQVGGQFKKKSLVYSFSCSPIGGFSESIKIRVSDESMNID